MLKTRGSGHQNVVKLRRESNVQRLIKLGIAGEVWGLVAQDVNQRCGTHSKYKLMAAMIYSSGESRPLIK